MTYLLFATALGLSAVAAYYSIMGLVAIFAAATVPILVMGSLLEVSKLVVASWLYRSWKEVPRLMKSYFTVALVVLMLLTSMGIFGFLSKAHLDQAVPTGDVAAKLSLIDEKIKTEKENLNAARAELNQLDTQVNETISRSGNSASGGNTSAGTSGIERSIAIRKAQQKDRTRILKEIGDTQTKIAKLQEERAPIATEVRKVEAEVGPIKYIAALIYGDNPEVDVLEKAVRWVIIMIVVVFDPLAVLMLIAANWNMRKEAGTEEHEPVYTYDNAEPPTEDEQDVGEPIKKSIEDFVPQPQTLVVEDSEPKPRMDFELVLDDTISPEDRISVQHAPHKELGRYLADLAEQEKEKNP